MSTARSSGEPAAGPRVCIVTLDPDNHGGILALMRFAYEQTRQLGLAPYLAYTSLGPHHQTILRLLHGEWVDHFEWREAQGLPGYSLGATFIEFEFLVYVTNLGKWRRALAGADAYLAVGGMNQCGFPLAWLRKPFLLWVASTLREERAAKVAGLRERRWWWRVLDRASQPLLFQLERFVFRRAARILALSPYTARHIVAQHGIPPDKVAVLPLPIDPTRFVPRSGPPPDPPALLMVGRPADPRKNVAMLLEAFRIVQRRMPSVTLTIVGGPPPEALVRRCETLGIADRVRFGGLVPEAEKLDLYRASTLLVLPSLQEGFGIVVLEAQAMGLPVVATRCGGPETLIVDRKTGLLVENDDPRAFAAAVLELLADPDLVAEMGRQAVEHVRESFGYAEAAGRFRQAVASVFPHLAARS